MTVLLREAIGDRLRHARTTRQRTLRDISRVARVSLGYLSEVERGQKEASSELLASICEALDLPLSDLLVSVAGDVSALDSVDTVGGVDGPVEPAVDGTDAPADRGVDVGEAHASAASGREGFEGGSLVTGPVGDELTDLQLSPVLRTTIHQPEAKAALVA
ncbi:MULTISPECIES: helix-turn-helix domain-containing protein [Prauserella salsuginis group]|uniref:Transcriptional regulator with XRE-family HTH domain n=2 Tax=Prauserella salsuginis group TaxID=2893672 RepID=A0A839XPB0_9PSEU|nr:MULTISPECIES: helix-turn-helix transcriptional regulator [Prauserella salsuginis group]MBB3665060.1 transcriptional regulator with XRE-family HTH domain [Prauserella sediminis]MCR3718531.1 Helix-turn-helix domain-containing protein [Prauserella flava]MCR3733101.1 Helix-turn-helix domain-containing protein [Prauserella salsuginis]